MFGFPGTPLLPTNATNLGFLDQHFALQWVQSNIHAFGGSPDKVTIFGESAGAASVDALVVSSPENPPFRAAISESGVSDLYGAIEPSSGSKSWDALVKGLNCTGNDDLSCVRAAKWSTVLNIIEHAEVTFGPIVDNYTLYSHIESLRQSGKVARVPWMTGTNANEGRAFVLGQTNTTEYLTTKLPLNAQEATSLESFYPIPSLYINNSYTQLAQIFTDFTFTCPAAIAFNDTHQAGIPAYRYYYNATFPNLQPIQGLGVWHSSEVAIVFGTYPQKGATTEQKILSKYMQTAWARFAKDPIQGPGWGSWPEVGVLGPVPSAKGYNGIGTHYVLNIEGPVGKLLDARCAAYMQGYQKQGVF